MASLLPSDTSNPYSLNGRLLSEITGQAEGQRRMAKYIEENRADHLKAKRKRDDDGEEEEEEEYPPWEDTWPFLAIAVFGLLAGWWILVNADAYMEHYLDMGPAPKHNINEL